jgi:PAS domain S-box-containing protein
MLLFGIILVILAVSAIITHQELEKASEQERICANIAQGASELSYLSNDYLIYRESQQLKRWESRFASLSNQVASLNVGKPDQQALVRNIQANTRRLKEVFESVASAVGGPSRNRSAALDLPFLQVSWSRMAVQSQGLVSDASRLSQLLHQQMDQLTEKRSVLMYVMVGLLGLFLLASYMLTYRRILKSITTLQAGTAVIGSGNLDFKIEEKKNDEIGDLSHAFNQMTTNLKEVTASKAELEREIAERKKAEEKLRRQREWLRVTLSSIGDAVIAADAEGRITFINPVAVALTGWQSDEALRQPIRSIFQIINEQTHEPPEDLVIRVLSEKRVVGLANDTALVTKDGREVPIEDSAAPILDATGNVTGVVLVFHDVTAKRRAQAALREAHERALWLARFPEENPNPVIRASADGTVLYCNPASAKLQGRTCEVGRLLTDPLLAFVRQALMEGQELQQDVELNERFFIIWVVPFPGEGYANVYARDITARKKAEEALRRSESVLRAVLDSSPAPIFLKDRESRLLLANPATFAVIGKPAEEVIGKTDAEFYDNPQTGRAIMENDQRIMNLGRMEVVEETVYDPDGTRVFLSTKAPYYDAEGRVVGLIGVARDITERKRAEEALQQHTLELQQLTETLEQRVQERTGKLEKANEALRHLSTRLLSAHEEERKRIAGEVHDSLGACLGGIKFKVEDALQKIGETSKGVAESLKTVIPVIHEGVEECRRIQMDLRPPMLDDLGLLPTLSWFCRRFQTIYSGIRVDQEVMIKEIEVPDSLKIVAFRITQEAMNNIAKHSKAERVRLALRKIDNGLELVLEDNGQGFDLEKVLASERTQRGLGLSSMRERTELSGGSFRIESTEGGGTAIRAWWPL